MVRTINSVLLVDFDSLHRSIGRQDPAIADQLATRAGAWLEAIETGDIMAPAQETVRRRFVVRRCYADPRLLGKNRGWLTANGVQIVDSGTPAGLVHGAATAHLVLDTLEMAESEPDEVILITAEIDLTPLLIRLRALNQRVVIYATDATAASYRAFADVTVEESALVELLARQADAPVATASGSIPRPQPMAAAEAPRARAAAARKAAPLRTEPLPASMSPAHRLQVDREALAALVRRIHQATNVPLFSPKTFTDLFGQVVETVAGQGYKFQSTVDTVAAVLNMRGRNVTKRQVGFVIKGLALRGHVFTAEDRPEDLAEAFYAQVLYLVEGAGISLSPGEKLLVRAWMGIRREAEPAEAPAVSAAPVSPTPASAAPPRPAPARPTASAQPSPAAAPPPRRREAEPSPAPSIAGAGARRAASASAPPPRRTPAPAAAKEATTPSVRSEPIEPPPPRRPSAAESSPAEAARRSGRSARVENGNENRTVESAPAAPPEPTPARDDLEDSILSAIAEAVDVLAEDRAATRAPAPPADEPAPPRRPAATSARPAAPRTPPRPAAPPVEIEPLPQESDEIGDEIQRILASYSQNR